jgi:hypothetical protein
MKRLVLTLVLAAVLGTVAAPREARADNSFNEVAKTTVLGAAAGLVVGGAIALLADDGEPVKWGFVLGTFGGLGYGLYNTNKSTASLLELRDGRLGTGGMASLDRRNGSVQVHAVGVRF